MSESSYLPPQPPPGLPVNPHLPIGIPRIVTVFGVMHIVFAVIGLLSAAWALFSALAGNPFMKMQGAGPEVQAQLALEAKLMTPVMTHSGLAILIGLVMITAGIKLLKGRRDGLAWSNKYAYLSLLAKVANLVMAFVVVIPATREMMGDVMKGASGMPASATMMMEIFLIAGAVGEILVTALYPVLALVLLNRKGLREWFAARNC